MASRCLSWASVTSLCLPLVAVAHVATPRVYSTGTSLRYGVIPRVLSKPVHGLTKWYTLKVTHFNTSISKNHGFVPSASDFQIPNTFRCLIFTLSETVLDYSLARTGSKSILKLSAMHEGDTRGAAEEMSHGANIALNMTFRRRVVEVLCIYVSMEGCVACMHGTTTAKRLRSAPSGKVFSTRQQ
eukprot:1353548-Amorphochlora_amoeboformis.AAC.1